jgi:hypothetical protein
MNRVAKIAAWIGGAVLACAAGLSEQHVTVVEGGGYFPVLIQLKSGELMAVLRGGGAHISVKGRLDIVKSRDGGVTWSAPKTVVDSPEDDRNPAFGQLADGTIVLAYSVAGGYDETGTKFKNPTFDGVYVMRSRDGGATWTKPKRDEATYDFYRNQGHVSPYGKIVQLRNGTALMAVYYSFGGERGDESHVFRSKDGGRTWGEPALIGKHSNETGLVVLPNGHVLAAMRSEKGGHLSISESSDEGHTWSEPVQITEDKEHPADLIVLKDGTILLVHGERNRPFGVHALFSRDGGKTFDSQHRLVLAADAPVTDCGYPSSVQRPDGKIVTMYYQVNDPKDAPASAQARAVIWEVPK